MQNLLYRVKFLKIFCLIQKFQICSFILFFEIFIYLYLLYYEYFKYLFKIIKLFFIYLILNNLKFLKCLFNLEVKRINLLF